MILLDCDLQLGKKNFVFKQTRKLLEPSSLIIACCCISVLADRYLRGAFGVLLVYDICDKPSFEHLEDWLTLIRDNVCLRTKWTVPVLILCDCRDLLT